MTLSLEGLRGYLGDANVRALLAVIAAKESGGSLTIVNGGAHAPDLSRHPFHGIPTTQGGRAAGRYQFLGTTWARLCERYGFEDFGEEAQTLGAIALIQGRNALADIVAGRFEAAVAKLRPEWTSLPGASESRAEWTMDAARALYVEHGGRLDNAELLQPAAPIDDRTLTEVTPSTGRAPKPETPKETAMPLPLLAIVSAITTWGPTIAALIPQVATLFDKKEQTPAKLEAAQAVVQKIVETTGAINTEAAINAVTSDAAMLEKVRAAVVTAPEIMPYLVVEVGGGFEAARKANEALMPTGAPPWQNPALWVTLLLILFPLLLVVDVFYVHPSLYSGELRTQIVTGVLGVIFVVSGYWLGGSIGSARKTDIMAAQQGAAK